MPDGFTVDVDKAEKAAKVHLPALVEHLFGQLTNLRAYAPDHGGGAPPELINQLVFEGYADLICERLQRGCEIINLTANALAEIVELYRRVDGQR